MSRALLARARRLAANLAQSGRFLVFFATGETRAELDASIAEQCRVNGVTDADQVVVIRTFYEPAPEPLEAA